MSNKGRVNAAKISFEIVEALRELDRDIVYSVCEWGENDPWRWARNVGAQLWRTTDDIVAKWQSDPGEFGLGIADVIDRVAAIDAAPAQAPGGWNDPDMLQVGNGPDSGQSQHEPTTVERPLTDAETRTHFGFWCLFGAPLMLGTDLPALSGHDRELVTNERLLAIDQDPLGIQGTPDRREPDREVWSKRLADGGVAVALLNRGESTTDIHTGVGEIDVPVTADCYEVLDCWTGESWTRAGQIDMTVAPRGTAVLRVTPQ
jgi:alpha-galactosidase